MCYAAFEETERDDLLYVDLYLNGNHRDFDISVVLCYNEPNFT